LSKKRDALRRGIRDLIEDTSRDLVAFEGREPKPHVPAPADERPAAMKSTPADKRPADASSTTPTDTPSLNGGPVETADDRSAAPAGPSVPAGLDHGVGTAPAAQAGAPDTAPPSEDAAGSTPADVRPALMKPEPAPFELNAGTAFLPPATIKPERPGSPDMRQHASHHGPGKKAKPARRAGDRKERASGGAARGGAVEPRPAAPVADDLEADDGGPAQAESRTGVCRSYFVNHDCWRVPNAYCNTALQVCVIRNCPVYHLHKDALERRFAKKFKHFW